MFNMTYLVFVESPLIIFDKFLFIYIIIKFYLINFSKIFNLYFLIMCKNKYLIIRIVYL